MSARPNASLSPSQLAWRRFRRNRSGVLGGVVFGLFCLIALLGYWIVPEDSPNANRQMLEWAKLPPCSVVHALVAPLDNPPPQAGFFEYWLNGQEERDEWIAIDPKYPLKISPDITIICRGNLEQKFLTQYPEFHKNPIYQQDTLYFTQYNGLKSWKLLAQFLPDSLRFNAQKQYSEQSVTKIDSSLIIDEPAPAPPIPFLEPSPAAKRIVFPLGTDAFGRDLLSRLMLGARVTLGVGLLALLVSLALGVTLGTLAGFVGGRTDAAIQWFMSVIWAVPSLLLAVAISFALGRGFQALFVAIGLSTWVDLARLVRGQTLALRNLTFIEATTALGLPTARVMIRHLLPNLTGVILIQSVANLSTAVLLEAGLSFLGLGVSAPTPSWGGMIYEGYTYLVLSGGKWMAIFPGLALMLFIISLNLLAIAVRDALDN